ncbi:MAG TPA: hypothetical protein VGM34_02525 [Chlamydiales bacterium]|jgi:hypothetical protein
MCSIFLAQAIGLFFLLISLSVLCRQAWWKKTTLDIIQSPAAMALSGILCLALGLLVVLTHNVWVADWHVVVTLFGWYMLAQGALRLFYPEAFARVKKTMLEDGKFIALNWVLLIGSIYLVWVGFFRY